MTDSKRITLPGPGSQPANPAPEPPAESLATAVLGTLPSSGKSAESDVPLADAIDDDDEPRGFNPFKFQRITVPPGLRADIIRWSREGKKERPPEDTMPPREHAGSDFDETSSDGDPADDPGSVMPVGTSGAPKLPLSTVRNFAIAVGLVLLPLAVLGVATAMRRHASTTSKATNTAPRHVATDPGAASPAPPLPTAERALPHATNTAPPVEPMPAARPATPAPAPTHTARADTPSAKRAPAPAPPPARSAQPKTPEQTGGNALDRPFSLPK